MTWKKITRTDPDAPRYERRSKPCVSRSEKRPDMAYMMLPKDMVCADRVSIYHDGKSRIAFQFEATGEYAVRPTSRTSYTMKVTIPKALAHMIPFGLRDVDLQRNFDGFLILDTQTVE